VRRNFSAAIILNLALAALGAQGTSPAPSPAPGKSASTASMEAHALTAAASKLGARLSWDSLTVTGYLERDGHYVSLKLGFPWLVLDGKAMLKIDPIELRGGIPYLTASAVAAIESWYSQKDEE